MSNKYLPPQKAKEFLIDTMPLSLLLAGYYKIERLVKLGRFDGRDFKLLTQFLDGSVLFVTPQILAETGNIILRDIGKGEFEELVKKNMAFLKGELKEHFIPKEEILAEDNVLRFGITDMSIFLSSKDKALVTADRPLRDLCASNKIEAHLLDEITAPKFIMG